MIDNCEHIIDAAATMVETLIRQCPSASVVATSREVLRIQGEYVYRVLPLDVPDEHQSPPGSDHVSGSERRPAFHGQDDRAAVRPSA